MKKIYLTISSLSIVLFSFSQTITYDFNQDPLANGWSSVIDAGSGNGITYNSSQQNVLVDISTGVEKNFIHTTLPYTLKDHFCVSFKIRPEAYNQNSFFPLILTPTSLPQPNDHPWRMNTPDGSTVGAIQTMDLLGVFVTHMEIKFINRNDNTINANSIVSYSSPFYMNPNTDYWVKLELVNPTSTRLTVYSDAAMTNELRNQLFVTPVLDAFNELYIANCNGNSYTSIVVKLDDYVINKCSVVGVQEQTMNENTWVIFPNPTVNSFEINGSNQIESIQVFDMKGAKVDFEYTTFLNGAKVILGDQTSTGFYLVEIKDVLGNSSKSKILKE